MTLNYVNQEMLKKLGSTRSAEKLEGTRMCQRALLDEDIRKKEILDEIKSLLIKNIHDSDQGVEKESRLTLAIYSRITGEKFPDLSLPLLEDLRNTNGSQEKRQELPQELEN